MATDNPDKKAGRDVRPLSPCTLICTLDDTKRCLGCGRTLAQISSWSLMSIDAQWEVIDELAVRERENHATIAVAKGDGTCESD